MTNSKDPAKIRAANQRYYRKYRAKEIARTRKWNKAHPEQQATYRRKNYRNDRAAALAYYGDKCACCGEAHEQFLTIDHVDGGGNAHRRAEGYCHIGGWLRRNKYPDGFRVLCHNCNAALGFYGYCH